MKIMQLHSTKDLLICVSIIINVPFLPFLPTQKLLIVACIYFLFSLLSNKVQIINSV